MTVSVRHNQRANCRARVPLEAGSSMPKDRTRQRHGKVDRPALSGEFRSSRSRRSKFWRGEIFPKGSYFREALRAFHDPAGTVVFALVLLRLFWRSAHSSPAMPESMRSWERGAARLTHYALYAMMVAIPAHRNYRHICWRAAGRSISDFFSNRLSARSTRQRGANAEERP